VRFVGKAKLRSSSAEIAAQPMISAD
jgi:hypothetical protein